MKIQKEMLLVTAAAAHKMGIKKAIMSRGEFFKINDLQPLIDDFGAILLTNIFTLARITVQGSRVFCTFDIPVIQKI